MKKPKPSAKPIVKTSATSAPALPTSGRRELLRLDGVSVGILDDRNYYLANIVIAGEGAKDAGEERLEQMTYYPCLHTAVWRAVDREVRAESGESLKTWAAVLERKTMAAVKAVDDACDRLQEKVPGSKIKRP